MSVLASIILVRNIMDMLALLLSSVALLSACSSSDKYMIYESSEGGGAALAINGDSGEYAKVMTGNSQNISQREFTHRLVTVRGSNYYYETQLRIVIPHDKNKIMWGDDRVRCAFQGGDALKQRLVKCKFSNGRSSKFRWSSREGVSSFFNQCLTKNDECEYKLASGTGIFSEESKSVFLQ